MSRASAPAADPSLLVNSAIDRTSGSLSQPHHDGSALYVLERPADPGARVTVRLRVPGQPGPESVFVRYVQDGEPRFAAAEIDARSHAETWWRASFPVWNAAVRYRWLLSGGPLGYAWVSGSGLARHDLPDADDFVITPGGDGPGWHLSAIVYEIFPDRFASSGAAVEQPPWALPRAWDALPCGHPPDAALEWFGGDLRGVEQHLDHLEWLGATALYLRSVFPATSTHRYDATSFDRIDPLLGGDDAFTSLLRGAHARGLRVIGDLTTNHTGDGHDWFRAASARDDAPERDFYFFDAGLPAGYEAWWDVATLPKLDWRSAGLRERMASVIRHWLDEGLDGWRIDVANMTGRRRRTDLHHDVARFIRASAGDALLIAEHCGDFRGDLPGDGWNGAMNYAGFMRPVWQWLRADDPPEALRRSCHGLPIGLPRLDGDACATTIRAFQAGIPWSVLLHSWSLLDSCDSARFRTVAGSRERQLVGVGLQMTLPGVPMICAGDEVGLEGSWAEDGRRTMPWERAAAWDLPLGDEYRSLIALRRSCPALQHGGMRIAHADADTLAYLRETPAERILCVASRDRHAPLRFSLASLGARGLDTLHGCDAQVGSGDAILPADGPSFGAWRLAEH